MIKDRTTINIDKSTREALARMKEYESMSYDDLLQDMIVVYRTEDGDDE